MNPAEIQLSPEDKAILRTLIAQAGPEGIPRQVAAEIISQLSRDALWKLQAADAEDVAFTAKSALPWWEQKVANVRLNQSPALVQAILEQVRIMQQIARDVLAQGQQAKQPVRVRIA